MIRVADLALQIASDLHLDHWMLSGHTPHFVVEPQADALILAGDICNGLPSRPALDWLKALSDTNAWPLGIYLVLGNHDYYDLELGDAPAAWRHALRQTRIQILSRDMVPLGGVRVAGCTLWTDFDRGEPLLPIFAQCQIRDYRHIRFGGELIKPEHVLAAHYADLNWLLDQSEGSESSPLVVVTHHAPTWSHVDPRRKGDAMNGVYASASEWVMDQLRPALWVHGHVHVQFDSQIGPTRVVSRPVGYFGEDVPEHSVTGTQTCAA